MKMIPRWIFAAPAACLLAACSGGDQPVHPEPPTPGTLTVSLATPAQDDRAVMITVSGPGIGTVASASGAYTLYTKPEDAGVRAALFGPLASGPLLRFNVPDTRQAKSYSATIIEVATAANQLRAIGAGYAVTVGQ
jgi:hypothetical protein